MLTDLFHVKWKMTYAMSVWGLGLVGRTSKTMLASLTAVSLLNTIGLSQAKRENVLSSSEQRPTNCLISSTIRCVVHRNTLRTHFSNIVYTTVWIMIAATEDDLDEQAMPKRVIRVSVIINPSYFSCVCRICKHCITPYSCGYYNSTAIIHYWIGISKHIPWSCFFHKRQDQQ